MASTYGETWALTSSWPGKSDGLMFWAQAFRHTNKVGKVTSMTFPHIESPSRGQQLKSSVFSCFEFGCFVLIVSNNPQTYLNHSQPIDLKLLFGADMPTWRPYRCESKTQAFVFFRSSKLLFEELSIVYQSLWTFWMMKFDKTWLLSLTLLFRRQDETSSTGPAFATCFDFLTSSSLVKCDNQVYGRQECCFMWFAASCQAAGAAKALVHLADWERSVFQEHSPTIFDHFLI